MRRRIFRLATLASLSAALLALAASHGAAQPLPVIPKDQRSQIGSERSGLHDAANIRTVFWNFGMVGDYPSNPGTVDLSVFHSVEVPKGSGMNYSDGTTPFVLARRVLPDSSVFFIMETGFRERQGISPYTNRQMRFEPRPGFFQADPSINQGRSPAVSNDPRTWPDFWPDRVNDPDDPGWRDSWNGYFGKRPAADQESYSVMDDDAYDAWPSFFPDSRDVTRRGLALRVEVRGFQWSNPQAGNVIFWHYDITNEGTTDYDDDIIFGMYMDSGVGGSSISCDGIFESDDDNANFDRTQGLNLVYTWDKNGHGRDLSGPCGKTGYLGYAYLETPGNSTDGVDNDRDGIKDERRDGGPGIQIASQAAILAYMATNYDTAAFIGHYGPIADRPAYRAGVWWTGDEDLDWRADLNDVGADGVKDTGDTGEGDGMPTEGEPNFDRTDIDESDQIGLTGFKMNRIRAGQGNPDPTADDIVFYDNPKHWPETLWEQFTNSDPAARFDPPLQENYNIGFLFASGPFRLEAGKRERFSLALAYGADLTELRDNVKTVQLIYNANYQFATPPVLPTVSAEAGDGYVRLSWDDVAERSFDPVTNAYDFEGYRIYRSTDPDFLDPKVMVSGRGNPLNQLNGKPMAQFDLADGRRGYSNIAIEGLAYWLGDDTGLTHTWIDTTAVNGQQYYYAVCAYDYGFDPAIDSTAALNGFKLPAIYPSEDPISISRTPRGGIIYPPNAVAVRPNPRVPGFEKGSVGPISHVAGDGTGEVEVRVVNTDEVPDGHLFKIAFTAPAPESIRATAYSLTDSTTGRVLFTTGADLDSAGTGPAASGLLPVISTGPYVTVDSASAFREGYVTNTRLKAAYQTTSRPINQRRDGFPNDMRIDFDNVVQDTAVALGIGFPARPAKFRIYALSPQGDRQLDFRFRDLDASATLNRADEWIDILTGSGPPWTTNDVTWRVQLDTLGQGVRGPIQAPALGDVYDLKIRRPLNASDVFVFQTDSSRVDAAAGKNAAAAQKPYVVPNPYVGAASFEPGRFATSGRGERRIEFRSIPLGATIRIYTVRGDLVQTLRQDGSSAGFVPWNLRSKDNLDVAPGLYVYAVEAPGYSSTVGKFAVIK